MSNASVTASLTLARDLGARGSRTPIGDADPAGLLTADVADVLSAVPSWWERQAHASGLRGEWLDVAHALDAEPPNLDVSGQPSQALLPSAESLAQVTAHELGSAYVAALSPGVRARHGRHYTPAALAEHLWLMARGALGSVRGKPARLPGLIRDPACGAGALLVPPLREHLQALAHADPRVTLAGLPNLVDGVDADPAAVWIANVVLAAEALPLLAATPPVRRRPLPALTRVGDGLAPTEKRARAVLMNPPYGRVRLSDEDRQRFAHVLYGHANLYSLFMAAALEQLDGDGVLAALVPTSFTTGRYFSNLRGELARVAPLREATFVAERDGVFAGVLQETCLAVFGKRRARRLGIASMNGRVTSVAKVRSPRGSAPWLLPRRSDDAHVAAAASAMPLTLAAAGWRVSTGPLVWNRRREDIHAESAPGSNKIVWAADLDGGELHRDRRRDTLRFIRVRDQKDAKVLELRTPALLVQRTTAPEQERRLVCAALTTAALASWGGRVVVENHVNVLRPRDASEPPLISPETLHAVLGTRCLDRVVRCLSGSVALSAYELEALPLPDVEILAGWESLRGAELERAVSDAYRP